MKKTYETPNIQTIKLDLGQNILNNSMGVNSSEQHDASESYSDGMDYDSDDWSEE